MPIWPGVKFLSAASKADSLELNIVITVILDVIKELSQGGWGGGRGRAPVLVGASGNAVGIPVGTAQNRWRYIKLVISAGRLGKLLSSMYFELNRPD